MYTVTCSKVVKRELVDSKCSAADVGSAIRGAIKEVFKEIMIALMVTTTEDRGNILSSRQLKLCESAEGRYGNQHQDQYGLPPAGPPPGNYQPT